MHIMMKKLTLIFTVCMLHFVSYAQEQVFTYSNNGTVETKSKFIEPFPNGDFANITDHTLQKSYDVVAPSGDTYTVKCYKNTGWENDPGDWHYFEILYKEKVIFSAEYADGWEYLADNLKQTLSPKADAFYQKNLRDDTVMLLFTGIIIMSQPPYETIVLLKDGKATLVYNKPGFIEDVQVVDSDVVFTLCENTVEFYEDGTPMNDGIIAELSIKDDLIYYERCTGNLPFALQMASREHEQFSKKEAQQFFEQQYAERKAKMRESGKRRTFATPGNFRPLWNKTVASRKGQLLCYNVPMESDMHYEVTYRPQKNSTEKPYTVNMYQKLIAVKNPSTGKQYSYFLHLIPTSAYEKKYATHVGKRFIYCGDRSGFSGVAFYTQPGSNQLVRVERYKNGICSKGVTIKGAYEKLGKRLLAAHNILQDFKIQGEKKDTAVHSTVGWFNDNKILVDDYVGTWRGERNDTIFTITLKVGGYLLNRKIIIVIGGYSLSVHGKVTDDYLQTSTSYTTGKRMSKQNLYIKGSYHISDGQSVEFKFRDQRKKHFNGEGILGGVMEFITPNKLHWTLDEKVGIWWETEGREDWVEVKPIGFSVPTDMILTKVKE